MLGGATLSSMHKALAETSGPFVPLLATMGDSLRKSFELLLLPVPQLIHFFASLVTQSQYTQVRRELPFTGILFITNLNILYQAPRCPSHRYRRDTDEIEDDLEDEVEALPSNATALDANTTRVASPRIGHLENGMKVMEVWGKLSIGDRIWIHDKTFLNGTHSEIVNMTTFEEAFGHLQSRQQC